MSSTTAAASSTWLCTGRRNSPRRTEDQELADHFAKLAKSLAEKEDAVVAELAEVQGDSVDIGGYYYPDREKTKAVMRPSETFNAALDAAHG